MPQSDDRTEGTPEALDLALPPEFLDRLEPLLGDELSRFLAALAAPATGLRVNTLRLSPERFRSLAPFELEPLPYPAAGFVVTGGPRPGKHPYHAAGLYYLQDPGAMTVGALVSPRPGERVLDLAAAPGGKATHLAALLGGEGVLVANDVSPSRARELAGNLERCGVRNAVVTSEGADRLAARLGGIFDRVLLDAPCSGESMFHKSEAARSDWSPAAVLGCARRQGDLLHSAAELVRPGGLLVYSTCTFSPEENEEAIARFLATRDDFEVAELFGVPGAAPGEPGWVPEEVRRPDLGRTVRLWPHRVPGAGHFVAGLRRLGEGAAGGSTASLPPAPAAARRFWRDFRDRFLHDASLGEGELTLAGQELYELPAAAPPLAGLRVIRPGWWLGTLHRDRFEPGHSLAMGLRAEDAREVVELDADGAEVRAYLRGETVTRAGAPGWALVTVSGFPLGWGKRTGSTVKNHYPKGLRWR